MNPLFSWHAAKSNPHLVEDVIALPLDDVGPPVLAYDVNEFRPSTTKGIGQNASFYGYPGFGLSYPQVPTVRERTGVIAGSGYNYLKLNTPSENGFSGGPTFSEGSLIGLVSGNTPDTKEALIVDLLAIGADLFQIKGARL